jgi:hypothetical protein
MLFMTGYLHFARLRRVADVLLDHRTYRARLAHNSRKLILLRFQDREKLIDASVKPGAGLRGIEAPAHGVAQRKLDTWRLFAEPAIYLRIGWAGGGAGGHGGGEH